MTRKHNDFLRPTSQHEQTKERDLWKNWATAAANELNKTNQAGGIMLNIYLNNSNNSRAIDHLDHGEIRV